MKDFSSHTTCVLILLLAASMLGPSGGISQNHFQRRNWTPQAMLYLKGAQGRRFISDESQRKDLYDRLQLETRRNTSPITISEAAAMFLSSLQKAREEGEDESAEQPGYLPDGFFGW
ncbi:spexin [Spea bombifrons]|uniref:spexin n=1 Tax=Spea bombifrons TaxID=233779 RepID=UPI00234A5E3A|nr:spexin [Spea bombifrons]